MKKIEFYCADENIVKLFPPVTAKKMVPEWYKAMTKYVDNNKTSPTAKERFANNATNETYMTIKNCIPVQDYITSGYVLLSSSDVLISPEKDDDGVSSFLWWTKSESGPSYHSNRQCPIKLNGEKHHYIKFHNPWVVKTPPGYSCLFYQPEFLFEERFKLFPGIVDTDKYEHVVNFPGFLTTTKNFKLEAGTPLMAVFPFKRDEWQSEIKIKEPKKMITSYIEQMYLKIFHSQKFFN